MNPVLAKVAEGECPADKVAEGKVRRTNYSVADYIFLNPGFTSDPP